MLGRRPSWRTVAGTWLVLSTVGLLAVLLPWVAPSAPESLALAGAVLLTSGLAFALAVRTGGRAVVSGGLALVLSAWAAVSAHPVLLASAALGTAVTAAVLGVMSTKPARRFRGVVREALVATGIAGAGALGAAAYGAEVSLDRAGYVALAVSLAVSLGLVYRLGAGLHGLGRRGLVMIVSGVGVLTVSLIYTEALATWGSPGLIAGVERAIAAVRDAIGAVPRPLLVLLGYPALAWGVSTRARRRQGWWVCAFGATGLSVVTVSLLAETARLGEAALTVGYSMLLGLGLGYLVIRADLFLTGSRGRRARRLEEALAHRPEPGRLHALQ